MEENNQKNTGLAKSKLFALVFAVLVISAVVGSLFGFISGGIANQSLSMILGKNQANSGTDVSRNRIIDEESAIIDTVEKTSPAVISIVISKDVPIFKNRDPFNLFFSPFDSQAPEMLGTEKQKVGGGSGFLVSADGFIVTNRHVVSDTNADYTVITSDGKEYPAKVMARHPSADLAVIKIEGKNFPVLELGESKSLKIGQTVIAIGYSLGEFTNTVNKGIISGLKRNITAGSGLGGVEQLTNIIQTDAAINPGNSGGPLIDLNGRAIGVNVAMAQGAENIGFAIPIGQVKKTIDQVKKQGKISIPFIGIRYIILNDELKNKNDLPYNYGALVVRGDTVTDFAVVPGSPADKAGIMENDIVLEINGKKIDANDQLGDIISSYNIGDEITLNVWHKGDIKEVKVKLEERK